MLPLALLAARSASALPDEPSLTPHHCRSPWRGAARPRHPDTSVLVDGLPIRIWYDPEHAHSLEILPLVAETLQTAWSVQVDQLGFRPPVLPDDVEGPEFDVYLVEYEPFAAYVSADLPYVDQDDDDGYNASTAYMVVDRRLPPRWVPSYLAHEFNHVLQYATDYAEPTLPIWEGTATAAQEWTVGAAGMWEIDVPSIQEANRFPLLVGDSYTIWYEWDVGYTFEYGTAMWVRFLDEKHGAGDGRGGARLWEHAAQEGPLNEPDAVDAFAATGGDTVGALLDEFALVRLLTGADWDERGLSDASGWGPAYSVPIDPLPIETLEGDHRASVGQPMITGQVYFELDPRELGPDVTAIELSAVSRDGLQSGLMVATWTEEGAAFDDAAEGEDPTLTVSPGGLSRIVVAVTNLGPDGWDGDEDPYVDGDQVLRIRVERALIDAPPTYSGQVPTLAGGGGCATAGSPSAAAWLVAAAAAARRRRR